MLTAGIDIGSITAKAAVLRDGVVLGTRVDLTGYNPSQASERVFAALLTQLGLGKASVDSVVATGYGRNAVGFAHRALTEIICHAAGAHHLLPGVRFIIDVGGQDSKFLAINPDGTVKDFSMNDKCAAGTGRFLEVMARALEADLDDFGSLSLRSDNPSKISSICTVFAESEVISLIAKGENREDIIAGIHESVALRISSMARRVGVREPVMMTGGVGRNIGVVRALERALNVPIEVSEYAQVNGAIGAAVIATRI